MSIEELLKQLVGRGHCQHNPLMVCEACQRWVQAFILSVLVNNKISSKKPFALCPICDKTYLKKKVKRTKKHHEK